MSIYVLVQIFIDPSFIFLAFLSLSQWLLSCQSPLFCDTEVLFIAFTSRSWQIKSARQMPHPFLGSSWISMHFAHLVHFQWQFYQFYGPAMLSLQWLCSIVPLTAVYRRSLEVTLIFYLFCRHRSLISPILFVFVDSVYMHIIVQKPAH